MTLALLLSVATVEPLCAEETAANDSVPGWYQTTVELNLRTRPSRKARRMAVAAEGTRLQLVDHCSEVGGWAKVVYNGVLCLALPQILRSREAPARQQEEPAGHCGMAVERGMENILDVRSALCA